MNIDDQPVIDTRRLFWPERQALLDLLASLSDEQWQRPTVCEGWSVHDVALHLLWVDISNISRRRDGYFGRSQDNPGDLDDLDTLVAFINELNNNWVRAARRMSPGLLRTMLRVAGEEWSGFVQTVDIEAMGDSIGWAGPDPAPVWLDIAREFTERWVHQQHIRDGVGMPGATGPEFLKPVLATFAMALPYALRNVDAAAGSIARLVITGASGGVWSAVKAGDGWQFAGGKTTPPAGTVIIDENTAWRLFTKGLAPGQARALSATSGDPTIVDAVIGMVTILA
jgi:uncharacterized protein (TIGR03083 family)